MSAPTLEGAVKILLVEDDKDDAQLVELLLARDRKLPHDIEWVETIAEGIEKLETTCFDVALVDLNLPDARDGEAVTRLSAAHGDVPIVVLSGNDDEELAVAMIEIGAQDYLMKGSVGTTGLNRAMRYAVERKATEVSLRERASVDILTGLSNRAEFEAQLDRAMAHAARNGTMVGVLLIDLDHFKAINDNHGHAAGDTVLHEFGERLRQCLRVGDTGARLGGDEFAVLLENLETVNDVRHWIQRAGEQLRHRINFNTVALPLSMSIGAAVYPSHGGTIEQILRRADIAMYKVKNEGRNGFALYNERMEDTLRERDKVEQEIHEALAGREFVPHFQPQISLTNGCVTGFEAVCRWLRTDKVFALPSEYIPLVQNFELIHELGAQIFDQVCAQMANWRTKKRMPASSVSIKVDTQELLDPTYAKRLISTSSHYDVAPARLRLEIPAPALTDANNVIRENLTQLASAAFRFSIERLDINSLADLRFPDGSVAALKLSKEQTLAAFADRLAVPVTRALINMAKEIGVTVIGEGIETARQFRALQQLGCDEAQGYFIARPMNPDNLIRWVERHEVRQQEREVSMTGRFKLPPPLKRFSARNLVN